MKRDATISLQDIIGSIEKINNYMEQLNENDFSDDSKILMIARPKMR